MEERGKAPVVDEPQETRIGSVRGALPPVVPHACIRDPLLTWTAASSSSIQIPIMLRSWLCNLSQLDENQLAQWGECPYDQVRRR